MNLYKKKKWLDKLISTDRAKISQYKKRMKNNANNQALLSRYEADIVSLENEINRLIADREAIDIKLSQAIIIEQ